MTPGEAPGSCRRVLTLAYHYPPLGGAGVQRMAQLARRLPDLGWEPTVITGPGGPESRWRPRDETVGVDGRSARVHRLPSPEPPHDVRWEGRLERWLRISSRWERWWATNVRHVAGSVDAGVTLVHASLAPYSTAETATALARRLGKPLVLDLEDPWALDEMIVYPSRLHRRLERRRMGRVLEAADAVVMNTPEARLRVLATFPRLSPSRVLAIPNAFEPLDFERVTEHRYDGRFRIVHTGSLHTEMGMRHRSTGRLRRILGGAVPGVDFLPRSHVFLLQAVQSVLEQDPSLEGAIEVRLAGVFTAEDRAVAAQYPFVVLEEFVPHRDTIALLQSADLLFLPMHDLPDGIRAGLVPHKTYEYLAVGRAILAAVPDGDARDLLNASGVARLVRPGDVAGIADALRAELERWRSGAASIVPNADVVASCSAVRLARDFAELYAALAGVASVGSITGAPSRLKPA